MREELLRQQQVLKTLMMGGAPEEPETQQEEPMRQRGAEEQARGIRRERSRAQREIHGRGQSGLLEEDLPTLRDDAGFLEAGGSVGFAEIVGADSASRTRGTVREVSRAIERDARRYDGGFTMY